MWYDNFTFFDKQAGLAVLPAADYCCGPLTAEELDRYPHITKLYADYPHKDRLWIPLSFCLPPELLQLLAYSNGGGIINGNREFGYFPLEEIRYYYFAYGFPLWAPGFLPVAFNGGGKFYAYDFRNPGQAHIVAASAGDLCYESSVMLGNTLEAVLLATHNIEDDLDRLYPAPEPDNSAIRRQQLKQQLRQLEQNRQQGLIDLKQYLLAKRRLGAPDL